MTSTFDSPQQEDQVLLLDSVPHPAVDASEPFIVASDRRVILAYPIAEADFEQFGPFDPDDDPFCAVLFPDTLFHRLGPPGDGNLEIHPLAAHGLLGFSVQEIANSSLTAEIAALASAETTPRHFVITFEASTFECVASDVTVVGVYGAGEIAIREAFSLVR